MKNILLVALVLAVFSGMTPAADGQPKLLSELNGMDSVKGPDKGRTRKASKPGIIYSTPTGSSAAPVATVSQSAPVARAVSEPATSVAVCPPPPCGVHVTADACTPVCATAATTTRGTPTTMVVEEVRMVPVKRRVVEEETYLVHEPRSGTYPEMRTRTAQRTIEVPTTKMVSEAKLIPVRAENGSAVRLARGVNRKVVVTTRKEKEEYQESYMTQVKYHFTVPVAKTRKVTRNVEEYQAVPVRRFLR